MNEIEWTPEKGEKCGIAGVYGAPKAVNFVVSLLADLQHRGQESAGAGTSDGRRLHVRVKKGLVSQVFPSSRLPSLPGRMAIGHTRYPTSGGFYPRFGQPYLHRKPNFLLAHNGNIPDVSDLEMDLRRHEIDPSGLSDSQLVAKAIGIRYQREKSLENAALQVFPNVKGAYSMLLMDLKYMIAVRDHYGLRPLSIGEVGDAYVFASETCAFGPIGAKHVRDVEPGELVSVSANGFDSKRFAEGKQKLDIFEFIYFARPDSMLLGKSVSEVRENFGRELAKEYPLDLDVIVPVPQSANEAALGYAQATGIPLKYWLIKGRDRRTFIEPTPEMQLQGVRQKLSPVPGAFNGMNVGFVEDSVVRGTSSRQLAAIAREMGAKKVRLLSASPPIRYPDFYGIDLPRQEDLIAHGRNEEEIAAALGLDSIHYLSYEGMIRATGLPESMFSTACFTGEYPLDIGRERKKVEGLPKEGA